MLRRVLSKQEKSVDKLPRSTPLPGNWRKVPDSIGNRALPLFFSSFKETAMRTFPLCRLPAVAALGLLALLGGCASAPYDTAYYDAYTYGQMHSYSRHQAGLPVRSGR